MNVLITGATGNVGLELISQLLPHKQIRLIAGVRDPARAQARTPLLQKLECRAFDFENPASFEPALQQVERVFLLRPPQLADVKGVFAPLIKVLQQRQLEVLFLSVQGADRAPIIPHYKIEKLILKAGLKHVLIRPSYFMQNLTTTLLTEMQQKGTLTLPAGEALFNWLDVQDIARLAAECLLHFDTYQGQALTLTGTENLNFQQVVNTINHIAQTQIVYRPVSPWHFYLQKRRENLSPGLILVMLLLHFLPRFQKPPEIVPTYQQIFAEPPRRLEAFIREHRASFQRLPSTQAD